MRKFNPINARLIKKFATYLSEGIGLSEATITGAKRALKSYQTFTRYDGFDSFSKHQVIGFKDHILSRKLGKTTLLHYTNDLGQVLNSVDRFCC